MPTLVYVKSLIFWMEPFVTHVPFASKERGVPVVPQCLGDGDLFERDVVDVVRWDEGFVVVGTIAYAFRLRSSEIVGRIEPCRIAPGHDADARGTADRACSVRLCETHARIREARDVGRVIKRVRFVR